MAQGTGGCGPLAGTTKVTSFRGHEFKYLDEGIDNFSFFEGWKHERLSRECLMDGDVFIDVVAAYRRMVYTRRADM